ncbi:MAG: hypothetical protein EZS28_032933, partial [Streblomastix strix]
YYQDYYLVLNFVCNGNYYYKYQLLILLLLFILFFQFLLLIFQLEAECYYLKVDSGELFILNFKLRLLTSPFNILSAEFISIVLYAFQFVNFSIPGPITPAIFSLDVIFTPPPDSLLIILMLRYDVLKLDYSF